MLAMQSVISLLSLMRKRPPISPPGCRSFQPLARRGNVNASGAGAAARAPFLRFSDTVRWLVRVLRVVTVRPSGLVVFDSLTVVCVSGADAGRATAFFVLALPAHDVPRAPSEFDASCPFRTELATGADTDGITVTAELAGSGEADAALQASPRPSTAATTTAMTPRPDRSPAGIVSRTPTSHDERDDTTASTCNSV